MKTSRAVAFVGAMGALVSMTAIAVSLGRLLSSVRIQALAGIKVRLPMTRFTAAASVMRYRSCGDALLIPHYSRASLLVAHALVALLSPNLPLALLPSSPPPVLRPSLIPKI